MRSVQDIQERWRRTVGDGSSLKELQRAVRYDGASSPCVAGNRSLCWKVFLLLGDDRASWSRTLQEARQGYESQRTKLLKYVKHPEALAELTLDPLADDAESPWNMARQDEIVRAEIQQDVQRLPDEANYHDERIQTMILDILFVYCKLHPARGGYRQGMHELLAPIVYVVEQDAVDSATHRQDPLLDELMLDVLDVAFVEYDAFAIFCKVMDRAQSFYELKASITITSPSSPSLTPSTLRNQDPRSAIVDRSKFIHEVCLAKVDPELASHLTSVEILPQIFLIRWVRLLFSREFPFDQFLVLWDTIFATDPTLDLVDLICVAMLLRIRWQLLQADYSVCLQLLLKYPAPSEAHGPQTFVDDALYLRNHMTPSGGASLIMKYTGKMPSATKAGDTSRPTTPNFMGFNALRQRAAGVKSPLNAPSRLNQAGMEALFQSATKGAKGVLERGERLGINQAVRDAMGEIRKNVQGFNDSMNSPRSPRDVLSDEGAAGALAAMERRNRQLASMLDETVANLKAVSSSSLEDKAKSLELIEIAAAKVQFVQIYLEDSSMDVPVVVEHEKLEDDQKVEDDQNVKPESEVPQASAIMSPTESDVDVSTLSIADSATTSKTKVAEFTQSNPDAMDTTSDDVPAVSLSTSKPLPSRPAAIPTRSTLAQSSFSWMLEPEQAAASSSPPPSAAGSKSPPTQHAKKRQLNNASREKNAFLFGEVTGEAERGGSLNPDEIFGMETIRKGKGK